MICSRTIYRHSSKKRVGQTFRGGARDRERRIRTLGFMVNKSIVRSGANRFSTSARLSRGTGGGGTGSESRFMGSFSEICCIPGGDRLLYDVDVEFDESRPF